MNAKLTKRLETEKALSDEKAKNAEERRTKLAEEHKLLQDRVAAVEARGTADSTTLAVLRAEMLPMAEAMKRKLVDILTHPSDHFVIPDALLAKVRKAGAKLPPELKPLLDERAVSTDPHVTEQEKLAAQALPIITKLAELEAKEPDLEVTGIQLVTSTAKTPETKREEEKHKPA